MNKLPKWFRIKRPDKPDYWILGHVSLGIIAGTIQEITH